VWFRPWQCYLKFINKRLALITSCVTGIPAASILMNKLEILFVPENGTVAYFIQQVQQAAPSPKKQYVS